MSKAKQDQLNTIRYQVECARDMDKLTLWLKDGRVLRNISKGEALTLVGVISQVGYC